MVPWCVSQQRGVAHEQCPMEKHFSFRYDYTGGVDDESGKFISDPPRIVIVSADGYDVGELHYSPTPTVEYPDAEDTHWKMPEEVYNILRLLNGIQ